MKNFFKNPKNLSVGFRIKPLQKSVFTLEKQPSYIYLLDELPCLNILHQNFFFSSSCAKLSFLWVLLPARKRITCSCTSKHCVNRNQMGVDNIWCIAFFKYTKSQLTKLSVPTNIYLFKVNERNTRSLRRSNVLSLLLTLNVIDTIF